MNLIQHVYALKLEERLQASPSKVLVQGSMLLHVEGENRVLTWEEKHCLAPTMGKIIEHAREKGLFLEMYPVAFWVEQSS